MEETDSQARVSADGNALLTLFFERARPARVVYPVAALLLGGCLAIVMPWTSVLIWLAAVALARAVESRSGGADLCARLRLRVGTELCVVLAGVPRDPASGDTDDHSGARRGLGTGVCTSSAGILRVVHAGVRSVLLRTAHGA